jgi:hypothetical protein
MFPGRADVAFKGYSLNEEELDLLKKKLSDSDLEDSFRMVEGMTDDSIQQMKLDIDEFLEDEVPEKKKEEPAEDINPFGALFSFTSSSKKKEKEKEKISEELKKKGVKKDSYAEQYLRNVAEADAINTCYNIFDIYKKSHGMASFPYIEDAEAAAPVTSAEETFGFTPKETDVFDTY